MMKCIVFFSVGFFVSSLPAQPIVGPHKALNLTLPNSDLKEDNKEWKKALAKERALFAQKIGNKKVSSDDLQEPKRKKGYEAASNPRDVNSQNNISTHPLMPGREQRQLIKSY